VRPRRILFVTPPGYGHSFPIVPLAWSFRLLGHEVLVATAGVSLGVMARAGIECINTSQGCDLPALFHRNDAAYWQPFDPPGDSERWRGADVFFAIGESMVASLDGTLQQWRPDLIVYTPYAVAAPVIATRHNIPSVFLGIALAYTPETMFRLYSKAETLCGHYDISTLQKPVSWIDVAPPTLRGKRPDGISMRYISYHGVDIRAMTTDRPGSVLVTLGTVIPLIGDGSRLQRIIQVARHVDAQFLVAHASPNTMPSLPKNVSLVTWAPLDTLIRQSCALIHHGGPGTMFSALNAGLPQMLIPMGSDQFHNADALCSAEAACQSTLTELTSHTIATFLADERLKSGARRLEGEISEMPPPPVVAQQILRDVC
jgi:UDP:flavonoid glycosyltransferase YjiC (YdhE family)